MFTAINCETDTAVSIRDMRSVDQHADSTQDKFRCLGCGKRLTYHSDQRGSQSGPFIHDGHNRCRKDGNASRSHRITQEGVAKGLYNWLPIKVRQIDLERRIGTASDFLIGDIVVGHPICIVVEIVCSGAISLKRRLQTMEKAGYTGMFVAVNGSRRAVRIDRYFRQLNGARVGRFDPNTFELRFGSLLTAKRIDFESSAWDQLPQYVS